MVQFPMHGEIYLIGSRPPANCQVCGSTALENVAYDVVLPTNGGEKMWFWTCGGCYGLRKANGLCRLGIGRGQRYEVTAEKRWRLAAGGSK